MKIGLSSYSLSRAMGAGEMNILDVIRWCAENGAEQVELVPLGDFQPAQDPQLCKDIVKTAADCGIELGNYSTGRSLLGMDEAERRANVDFLKREIDAAASMGIRFLRHDVAHYGGTPAQNNIVQFNENLPMLAEVCAELADYAAQYGITNSVENHGWYMNGSERVLAMVNAVNRPNFKLQLDIGNFLCVDEEPMVAVTRCLPYASVVHFKDFYIRHADFSTLNAGGGWFQTQFGTALMGAVVGWGDVNIPVIAQLIKDSGFDGNLSIEFEGSEECRMASKAALAMVKKHMRG